MLSFVEDASWYLCFFFFQAEDGIRDYKVTGVQTCALPISRRLGLTTTGNAGGIHNLIVSSAQGALDAAGFLERLDTGLLVTELMGQGVNGVTGDYSRGASGFWVERGAILYPVNEITIAGNLSSMYRHIVALGDDHDVRGGIRTGSVLLSEMTIAGE